MQTRDIRSDPRWTLLARRYYLLAPPLALLTALFAHRAYWPGAVVAGAILAVLTAVKFVDLRRRRA